MGKMIHLGMDIIIQEVKIKKETADRTMSIASSAV
jgi:hypothetical protein